MDGQLIFLGWGELSQIDSCDLSSDSWCKVLNFLRSAEQDFLLWISKVASVCDVDLLEGFPTDDGEVWLQYAFVIAFRLVAMSLTL